MKDKLRFLIVQGWYDMLNETFWRFGGETGGEKGIFIYESIRFSPSPPFVLRSSSICNKLASKTSQHSEKTRSCIKRVMKPFQDKSSCLEWLFCFFGGETVVGENALRRPSIVIDACSSMQLINMPSSRSGA